MVLRTNKTYNFENLLSAVHIMNGTCTGGTVLETTSFIYDGDGNLVKKINPDLSKTIYVGGVHEVDKSPGGSVTHTRVYYPAGGAMRVDGTLYYVLKDHLGSASVVTDASGNVVGEQRYYPYGETRLTTGSIPTDKLYTGQREMADLGIYHYNARIYSPYINRFLSADTIIPDLSNPQSWNRYSYVTNRPVNFSDPSGYRLVENEFGGGCSTSGYCGPAYEPPNLDPGDYCDTHPWACGGESPDNEDIDDILSGENDEDGVNPNDVVFDLDVDKFFNPLNGYTHEDLKVWDEIRDLLYGDELDLALLAIEACANNFCNNPLTVDLATDPGTTLGGEPDVALSFYYSGVPGNLPLQLFIREVGADGWEENPWNFEPNWIIMLQLINPSALDDAKDSFREIYFTSPDQYNLLEYNQPGQ